MNDTQWARYQVFVQEAKGKPHLDYGSVHAPDAELALLNARDVFARRPECISMWVVPTDGIYSITAEEIKERTIARPEEQKTFPEPYCVFTKSRQAGTMSYTRTVNACSPTEALEKALSLENAARAVLVWWIFPERLVTRSNDGDVDSYYTPAREKGFRLSNDFHTLTDMRKIKHTAGKGAD